MQGMTRAMGEDGSFLARNLVVIVFMRLKVRVDLSVLHIREGKLWLETACIHVMHLAAVLL